MQLALAYGRTWRQVSGKKFRDINHLRIPFLLLLNRDRGYHLPRPFPVSFHLLLSLCLSSPFLNQKATSDYITIAGLRLSVAESPARLSTNTTYESTFRAGR